MAAYRTVYNKLNKLGEIDTALQILTDGGMNTNEAKLKIIDDIKYIANFENDSSFKRMTYWHTATEDNKTYRRLASMYTQIKLAELTAKQDQYSYWNASIRI